MMRAAVAALRDQCSDSAWSIAARNISTGRFKATLSPGSRNLRMYAAPAGHLTTATLSKLLEEALALTPKQRLDLALELLRASMGTA